MLALEMHRLKARYFDVEGAESLSEQYEVKEILARRSYAGEVQYLVSWVNYTDTTWVSGDRLNCIDLLEEFEGLNE